VLNGIIKRQEMGDFIVDLGRTEAVLPRKEQSRAETYQPGDRVRVAIVKVLKAAKGPQVIVSRTDPALLIKLFEMEVPEIYDGTVQIRGCVREAGERAKVAVDLAREGRRPGRRLRGHEGHARAVDHPRAARREDRHRRVERRLGHVRREGALARQDQPRHDRRRRAAIMEVVVEDKQLSLAIGKKGQNVRLAAKLVGWRIDIKSEEEKRQEVEAEMARMARMVEELKSLEARGVPDKVIQKLIDLGVQGVTHLLEISQEELESVEGVGPKTAEKIREAAAEAKAEWDQKDAEEQARQEAAEAARVAAEQALAEPPPEEPTAEEPAAEEPGEAAGAAAATAAATSVVEGGNKSDA
jgi:N utilization substance protein A